MSVLTPTQQRSRMDGMETMTWEMVERGTYRATDELGSRWVIAQAGVSKWEVLCDGEYLYEMGSLRDAKVAVVGDVKDRLDPERIARRDRRRAQLCGER